MRLLLAGDIHGNPRHAMNVIASAAEFGCDKIVQLGDFGYWEHMEGGAEFLDLVSGESAQCGIPFYWIDGNHENHDKLKADYPIHEHGFRPIRDNLFHIPRGTVWEWDGVTFMGFGGAYSIDKAYRKEGVSWWADEWASRHEVEDAVANAKKVDVMFTHDCPDEVPIDHIFISHGHRFSKGIPEAMESRWRVSEVFNAARPSRLFHGHYHLRYDWEHKWDDGSVCLVDGLAADVYDSFKDSWTVLDTEHDL